MYYRHVFIRKAEKTSRSGRPSRSTSDENMKKIKEIVLANRKINIREVAEGIGILYGSCEAVFMNVLNMKQMAAKFIQIC